MTTKQTRLVIYESPNGRGGWHPMLPSELPDWVKHPDIIGHLVAGEMCCDPALGEKGSNWYKAVRVLSPAEKAAEERRARRAARKMN